MNNEILLRKVCDGIYKGNIRDHRIGIVKQYTVKGWHLVINDSVLPHTFKTKKEALHHAIYLLD